MAESIICDTSVLLYLGRVGQIALLHQRYPTVYTTESAHKIFFMARSPRS
jgi:predicted nucleic acid-binding protein